MERRGVVMYGSAKRFSSLATTGVVRGGAAPPPAISAVSPWDQRLLGLSIALCCTAAMTSCRWPELLQAQLLAPGGTYLLGATFGQPIVVDDNGTPVTTLSPGIVIWTADDNASALLAPVGGTLDWIPDGAQCPPRPPESESQCGVLRLTPRPTGEGGEGQEGEEAELRARTDLIVHVIQFEGMDRDSVVAAIEVLAAVPERDQDAATLFAGGFGVEPGERLGQATRVEAEEWKEVPDPSGGAAVTLTRRVLLTVSAADHPAYVDPYLFFPEDVDGLTLSPQHASLLGDDTPPVLSGQDIRLYPHSDDQSVGRLEPRDANETMPQYDVEAGQFLDLAVLARDLGAGACDADGCAPSSDLLGVRSITYYLTDDNETLDPIIGPVTVDLRCLDAVRFDQPDPTGGLYRADTVGSEPGFLYDVTAMRARSDACLSYEAGFESGDPPNPVDLALDTGLLVPDATYTLVVTARSYGGGDPSPPPSGAPGLPGTAPFSSAPGVPPPAGQLDKVVRVKLTPFFARPPPTIDLRGPAEIDVGQTIQVETSVTTNGYGEELTFAWEIVEAPGTSPVPVGPYAAATGPVITIATDATCAGTWVFRLTAKDENGSPPMVATGEHTVLVDAPVSPDVPGRIASDSDAWLSINATKEGHDFVTVHYTIDGGAMVTDIRTRAYMEGQTEPLYDQTESAPLDDTVIWDGHDPLAGVVPAGRYRITVTSLGPGGDDLGESARFPVVAYALDLAMDGVADAAEESPGAFLAVGSTVHRGHVALEPAGLDGEVVLQELAPTTALEAGVPAGNLAAGIAIAPAAANPQAAVELRVRERPAGEVRMRARYLPLGAPPTKAAIDEVVVDPVALDVTALCSNDDREQSEGIFVQRRQATLPSLDFAAGRFMMRELHLTSSHRFDTVHVAIRPAGAATVFQAPPGVSVTPTALGADGNIDPSVFGADGALDTELFVRGIARGEADLVVELLKDGSVLASDTIKLRVGDLPPLAGQALPSYPHWRGTRAVTTGQPLGVALDPAYHDERRTLPAKVYLVNHKTAEQWAADPTLTDVTGGAEDLVVPAAPGTITTSQTAVWAAVDVPAGVESLPLAVVIDYGGCPSATAPAYGTLDPEDIILPLDAPAPSLVALGDLTAPGPFAIETFEYGNDFENGDDFKDPPPVDTVCTPREDLGYESCTTGTDTVHGYGAVCVDDDGDGAFHWTRVQPRENPAGAACPPPCPNGQVCWDGDRDGQAHCTTMNLPEDTAGAACPPGCPIGSGCYDTDGDSVGHCTAAAPLCAANETCVSTNGDEEAHCRPLAKRIAVPQGFDTLGMKPTKLEANCSDGIDNNNDGDTDCDDVESCMFDAACRHEADCGNGVDDDGDGRTDCDDFQCLQACWPGFRLRARVVHPNPIAAGAPLVVLAHGLHRPFTYMYGLRWQEAPTVAAMEGEDAIPWRNRYPAAPNYRGFTYLQTHLASHGFVTVSVDLDELSGFLGYPWIGEAGIRLRGWLILKNIEHVLKKLPQLAGVDEHKIYLIGHSRGGEGVLEAWWILGNVEARGPGTGSDATVPDRSQTDIKGVMSIAPTSFNRVAPPLDSDTPFFLLYGTADGDVQGAGLSYGAEPRGHYDRADGPRVAIQLRGGNHNHFNTSWLNNDSWVYDDAGNPAVVASRLDGPEQRSATMAWGLGWLRAVERKPGFSELFNQPATRLPAGGVPGNVLAYTQSSPAWSAAEVLDDYEFNDDNLTLSSTDRAVAASDTLGLVETKLADPDRDHPGDPADFFDQDTNGAIVSWTAGESLTVSLVTMERPSGIDLRDRRAVVLRAAQQPGHANTVALTGSLTFAVTLFDGEGHDSSVSTSVATELTAIYPVQIGAVDTTAALFQTIRIDLDRFVVNKPEFRLDNVTAVRLEFSGGGSTTGAIGLDDLEFE